MLRSLWGAAVDGGRLGSMTENKPSRAPFPVPLVRLFPIDSFFSSFTLRHPPGLISSLCFFFLLALFPSFYVICPLLPSPFT